ncbi:MAG: hypothetical protein ACYC9N_22925, partial [Thermoanaerobaculia bacterium]
MSKCWNDTGIHGSKPALAEGHVSHIEAACPTVADWLEVKSDRTAAEILERAQHEYWGMLVDGQLRTLQQEALDLRNFGLGM